MTTSLLTIGTEITTGETLNTNAHWMAGRLEHLGFEVRHHLSVPDERLLMRQALEFLSDSNLLFVTGGLGPTQDDITREVVADWLNENLEFSNEAWESLQKRAQEKGIPIRQGHKHQCYFPQNAVLIPNQVGSALGFLSQKGLQKVFVLPGPPKELSDMWQSFVEAQIGRGSLSPWRKWVFEGLRESEVSERFETVLRQFSDPTKMDIGYRASPPLVHVKIREAYVPKELHQALLQEFGANLKE